MHVLPVKYLIGMIVVVAVILGFAWFYSAGKSFGSVSLIGYGFIIGYSAAFIHSRVRENKAKIKS